MSKDTSLKLAQDFRATLLSEETADKITMRVLGTQTFPAGTPITLSPEESPSFASNAT